MIPKTLEAWTIPVIMELLAEAPLETDSFDWKGKLPYRDEKSGREAKVERQKLSKSCCAFANSNGGFLVYGIADDKTLSPENRLEGIAPTVDFLAEFGEYPAKCHPKIAWHSRSLKLESGNFIHIVHIPKSSHAPHCASQDYNEWHSFPRRTNKGTEYMSYEEIKSAFLLQGERAKLLQLKRELEDMGQQQIGNKYGEYPTEFRLGFLEELQAGISNTLAENTRLHYVLKDVNRWCLGINAIIQEKQQLHLRTLESQQWHRMQQFIGVLANDIQRAIEEIDKIIQN